MEKPFLVCHMFVSMDGKIDGAFMGSPDAVPARNEYGRLREFYHCTATISCPIAPQPLSPFWPLIRWRETGSGCGTH